MLGGDVGSRTLNVGLVGPEKKAPRGPFSMSEPANYLADSGFFGSANLAPAALAK